MQYSRNLIFKVLDPYKCDWRYAFILEHFHKSFDKVNKQGEKYWPRVLSPTKGVLVPSKALNRAGYLWKYCEIINSTVMQTKLFVTPDLRISLLTSNPGNSAPKF